MIYQKLAGRNNHNQPRDTHHHQILKLIIIKSYSKSGFSMNVIIIEVINEKHTASKMLLHEAMMKMMIIDIK